MTTLGFTDAELLDFLATDPPWDSLGDVDVHEVAADCATDAGRDDTTTADYQHALRVSIARAMLADGRVPAPPEGGTTAVEQTVRATAVDRR